VYCPVSPALHGTAFHPVLACPERTRAGPRAAFHIDRHSRREFHHRSSPRVFDKDSGEWRDGDPLFLRCTVWQQSAENLAGSLSKGTRVIVTGRLRRRSFETREGEKRTSVELAVDEIGVSLR
jgi:Single-strand binding protein family